MKTTTLPDPAKSETSAVKRPAGERGTADLGWWWRSRHTFSFGKKL